jgi:hypothetical protein
MLHPSPKATKEHKDRICCTAFKRVYWLLKLIQVPQAEISKVGGKDVWNPDFNFKIKFYKEVNLV